MDSRTGILTGFIAEQDNTPIHGLSLQIDLEQGSFRFDVACEIDIDNSKFFVSLDDECYYKYRDCHDMHQDNLLDLGMGV